MTDNFRVFYFGTNGHARVGLIANKKVENSVSQIRDGMVPVNTTIIVVYIPTSKADTEEIEEIYGQIEDVYKSLENTKKSENL